MSTPALKSIKSICDNDTAKAMLIKDIMTGKNSIVHDIINNFVAHRDNLAAIAPKTEQWINSCYNMPSLHDIKMHIFDELLGGYGIEYISKGHNSKSPAIEYVNFGDTYDTTLLFIDGRYRIGTWGDIVERGNYD
jgi:hypothetical protein